MDSADNTTRRAVVTGAARGIGRAVVDRLIRDGFRVAALDLSWGPTSDLAATYGDAVHVGSCDVSAESSVSTAWADAREHMGGPIRTLVNCAGVCLEGQGDEFDGPVHDLPLTAWQHTLDVNLTGSFLLSKYAVADMLEAGSGSVVHIASVGGNRFGVNNSAYSASKAGISGLVRSMATAYGPMDIRTNAVCPGPVDTRMSQMAKATGEERENWLRRVPARRIGRADEVADVAAFLCGSGSTFVNGSLVYVDGGMSSA